MTTPNPVEPVTIANTALALMEHLYDRPKSAFALAAEKYRMDHGSYELRDRLWEFAGLLERGAWLISQQLEGKGVFLCEELQVTVGCWDFEVVPAVADTYAQAFFSRETLTEQHMQDLLLDMSKIRLGETA